MNLFNAIIKEYLLIIQHLAIIHTVENDRIIIERDEFKQMLEKYSFASFAQKVKCYKALNLLVHDKDNYTMPYKDKELKKNSAKSYHQLQNILHDKLFA